MAANLTVSFVENVTGKPVTVIVLSRCLNLRARHKILSTEQVMHLNIEGPSVVEILFVYVSKSYC